MFTINFYDNIIFNFYAQSGVLFQTHKDTYSKYVVVTGNNKKGFPYVKHFFCSFLCNHENVVEFGVSFCHKFHV